MVFLLPLGVRAQFTYSLDQSIPVKKSDGTELKMAWAGGLNSVQTNTMDLNHDMQADLVLFDRMANKILTFLRTDDSFVYAPEYEIYFPGDILNWVLLRDFNCDGKKDLFTGDNLGMKVYTNVTETGGFPNWDRFQFSTRLNSDRCTENGQPPPPCGKTDVLVSEGFSCCKVNVQLQFDDLPSISDVDGDGDLDIFVMRYIGNGNIEYHRNMSVENNWGCDSLDFVRVTQAWGNVRECSCARFAFNGADCAAGGRTKHAGGKSLLALDLNNNSEPDLLFSESECSQLFELRNEGTGLSPVINEALPFPASTPATFVSYPTPYFEDIDNDGVKDLMVSSNLFAREFLNSNFTSSNYFYRNNGTNSSPDFTLVQRDFLQADMIDHGDNSVPALLDFDGDEDLDLFISSHNGNTFRSPILIYENAGTSRVPDFKLYSEDFLGFSFVGDFNRKIQFADINNDNTTDLVYTSTDGNTGITSLNFIANGSTSGLDFTNSSIARVDVQINRDENVYVFDVDGDGACDLLIGRTDGSLHFLRQTSPLAFVLEESEFLGLGSSVLRQNVSVSIADLDADGKLDFIYGDQTGTIKIVSDFKSVANAEEASITNIVYNANAQNYVTQNLGGRIWPRPANIFGSTRPALIVGNALGGIHVLNSEGPDLPDSPVIDVYPNPLRESQRVSIRIDRPAVLEIFSILGQRVSEPVRMQPFTRIVDEFNGLRSGIYVLKFSVGRKSYSRKLIIDR